MPTLSLVPCGKKKGRARTERAPKFRTSSEVVAEAETDLTRRSRVALLASRVPEQRQLAVEVVLVRQVQRVDGSRPGCVGRRPRGARVQHAIRGLAAILRVDDARDGVRREPDVVLPRVVEPRDQARAPVADHELVLHAYTQVPLRSAR